MKIALATMAPHLDGAIAAQFETAPYYLIVDTFDDRMEMFPHPAQFQAECSPTGLLQHLQRFAPEIIVAGNFSAEVRKAALARWIVLQQAAGRVAGAMARCARAGLTGCRN